MLLNEETGYFRQIPGWNLNCAAIGAVLAELSLVARIDTDMTSLILLDETETGDPILDPVLNEIAREPEQRSAQYWIERLSPLAESIIDFTLERLVDLDILEHHAGDFWSLSRTAWRPELYGSTQEGTAVEFVKMRIGRMIFDNVIPDPRDIIIICLANACDVLRHTFELDDNAEKRIELICQLELIGRAIANAIEESLAGPALRRPTLSKPIPRVPLRKLLFHRHSKDGNLSALLADLAAKYGPIFQFKIPFSKNARVFLAGPDTNRWTHRYGRLYITSRSHFADIEKTYGAHGLLPALDGPDHFRLRKALRPSYGRARAEEQIDGIIHHARAYISEWNVGDAIPIVKNTRRYVNSQFSPLLVSIDSQDVVDDLIAFKIRALNTHVAKVLPKFLLNTPGMKRRAKAIDTVMDRIQVSHTPAQRSGCPRDHVDDILGLHHSDPQLMPEANLRFVFTAPLLASMYLGDQLSFAIYAMISQPELYTKIRAEADELFAGGDPQQEDLTSDAIDVTQRFIMECLRMYPIVGVSLRTVINTCVVEDYVLQVGSQVHIAQTASHYMSEVFPDPFTFDIDRYLPSRKEHLTTGYAPFGLGTHRCLGFQLVEWAMAINLLLLAYHFTFELPSASQNLKISMVPSMSPKKNLKFVITEQRHELHV